MNKSESSNGGMITIDSAIRDAGGLPSFGNEAVLRNVTGASEPQDDAINSRNTLLIIDGKKVEKNENSKKRSKMKILANGTVMKVQEARQRKILSCVYCHSKKIKCSRTTPMCSNCSKLGIDCKYFINDRVSRGGKKQNDASLKSKRGSVSEDAQERWSDSPTLIPKNLDEPQRRQRDSDDFSSSSGSTLTSVQSIENLNKVPSAIVPELSLNYLNLSMDGLPHRYDNIKRYSAAPVPNGPTNQQGTGTNSLLQTPIMNNSTNNMSGKFFNHSYGQISQLNSVSGANQEQLMYSNGNGDVVSTPDSVNSNQNIAITTLFGKQNFNDLDSPTMQLLEKNKVLNGVTGDINSVEMHPENQGYGNDLNSISNQDKNEPHTMEGEMSPVPHNLREGTPTQNLGLQSSLTGLPSNPATKTNYLYGTNMNYYNENLLDDLIRCLPTRERSYELINRYINSVHILLPVMVNLFDFVKVHDKFWDNEEGKESDQLSSSSSSKGTSSPESSQGFNYLQFYTLHFPILYASTISEFEEYDNLLLNQELNKYLKAFNMICQYYNYPHGLKTMPLLLGNIIIQSTSPNPSTMEMSQIIRYGKFLQLHKDPVITLRIADWEVIKFRRLLWWVIFGLDALSSHNFHLPPVCRCDDFNVLMPDEDEPFFDKNGAIVGKKLNASILSMKIKFGFDRILSELVYELHNGLSANIAEEKKLEIKEMIKNLFLDINRAINRLTKFYKNNPPATVHEMNVVNFIKNHSWSFVDRALMLLHKKILLTEPESPKSECEVRISKPQGDSLSLTKFEDTFGHCPEANIITNFNNSSIAQLKFNQFGTFSYDNLKNNLIPSILHNLNDFLKYNDFIKYGKFNWYIKRTIPIDSIILLFIIICVKLKYEFMSLNELVTYVNLINKALYILNRKWFKNEKYKRMLSLTNLTWEYILKKYNIVPLISSYNGSDGESSKLEFFDYQVTGYMNMSELFSVMNVPLPVLPQSNNYDENIALQMEDTEESKKFNDLSYNREMSQSNTHDAARSIEKTSMFRGSMVGHVENTSEYTHELTRLNEKIYYDLRNNFVDVNDYCTFYSSLENLLHELMEYIHKE